MLVVWNPAVQDCSYIYIYIHIFICALCTLLSTYFLTHNRNYWLQFISLNLNIYLILHTLTRVFWMSWIVYIKLIRFLVISSFKVTSFCFVLILINRFHINKFQIWFDLIIFVSNVLCLWKWLVSVILKVWNVGGSDHYLEEITLTLFGMGGGVKTTPP